MKTRKNLKAKKATIGQRGLNVRRAKFAVKTLKQRENALRQQRKLNKLINKSKNIEPENLIVAFEFSMKFIEKFLDKYENENNTNEQLKYTILLALLKDKIESVVNTYPELHINSNNSNKNVDVDYEYLKDFVEEVEDEDILEKFNKLLHNNETNTEEFYMYTQLMYDINNIVIQFVRESFENSKMNMENDPTDELLAMLSGLTLKSNKNHNHNLKNINKNMNKNKRKNEMNSLMNDFMSKLGL